MGSEMCIRDSKYGIGLDSGTVKYMTGGSNHKWYYSSSAGNNGTEGMRLESGNLTVAGNLNIQGTTITVNTANLSIDDKTIELGHGANDDGLADGGGIILKGTDDKKITWDNANSAWHSNKSFRVSGSGYFTGNVGIGTTSPSAPLEVFAGSGNTDSNAMIINNSFTGGDEVGTAIQWKYHWGSDGGYNGPAIRV